MLFLHAIDIPPAKFRGEMSHGKVDNSRTRRALEIRIASYLPLWGPREEVKYWNRSTCNFGNFASARVWLSNLRRNPFVGRFGRYLAFRLCLALLISHAFLRPHVVDTVPSLPPRHFLPTFKIDELARERRDRFDTQTTRPRQRFVENSPTTPP